MKEDGKVLRVGNIFDRLAGGFVVNPTEPVISEPVPSRVDSTSIPVDEPDIVEGDYDIGVGEQDDVSLDFTPGVSVEQKKITGSGSSIIHGKDRAADPVDIPKSDGEFYHNIEYSYTDLNEHTEPILDQASGRKFISGGVMVEAPSTNTSNVDYKFSASGEFESLGSGRSLSFDKLQIQKVVIRLKTSNDKLRVRAW